MSTHLRTLLLSRILLRNPSSNRFSQAAYTCTVRKKQWNSDRSFELLNISHKPSTKITVISRCLETLALDNAEERQNVDPFSNLQNEEATSVTSSATATSPVLRVGSIKKELTKLFNFTPEDLKALSTKYPSLFKACQPKTLPLLEKWDFTKEKIILHPWIITLTPEELQERVLLIKREFPTMCNPWEYAGLLKLQSPRLSQILSLWKVEMHNRPHLTRVHYMAEVLERQISEIMDQLDSKRFLTYMPLERIESLLDELIIGGVSKEDISKDMWIFRHNKEIITERLKYLKSVGVEPIKPWLLRCTDDIFSRSVSRYIENKAALGAHADLESYLVARLQCSPEEVAQMARRNPLSLTVSMSKLKEMLDFLFAEGFSPQSIAFVPRVLCHKRATLQQRLADLKALGYSPTSLTILTISETKFQQMLNKLKKKQKLASAAAKKEKSTSS